MNCERCGCEILYGAPGHDPYECIGSLVREREKDKAALALTGETLKSALLQINAMRPLVEAVIEYHNADDERSEQCWVEVCAQIKTYQKGNA